jgi:hypothetical protein
MRKKLYYSDSQIQKNLYTQGKEWMTIDDWVEYRGYYHRYITGEIFTGPDWNAKTSKKLIPYKSRSKMFFEYIDTKNYMTYNGEKKEIIGSSVFNASRYKAPRPVKRKPTDDEILSGVMTRYFVYKRNEPNRLFFEINKGQHDLHSINNVGMDQSLYGTINFNWKLDGPEYDIFENGLLVNPGVFDTNKRIVLRHSKKFPKLAEVVTDFFEYTVYDI